MDEAEELVLSNTASNTTTVQTYELKSEAACENDRAAIVSFVRNWGGATSDAVLDPAMLTYSAEGINGFVGYRLGYKCAIVFGDPICPLAEIPLLATAFHRFAEENNLSVVYIGASKIFAQWAMEHVCKAYVEFGEELIFDPSDDPRKKTGTHGSLVRRKVKRAVREGVSIHEYAGNDPQMERAIEENGAAWLRSRKGPQIHISNVHLFDDREGKRWFYALQNGKLIGSLSLNRIHAHEGWLINHLMVIPDAPGGTSELLFTSVLEALDKEGCRHATVGMIAAKQLGEMKGLGKFSVWFARFAFAVARKIFDLDGLNTFWKKFHPRTEPSLILFGSDRVGIWELLGISRAMNGPF